MRPGRRRAPLVVAATLAGLVAGLPGCGSSGGTRPSPSSPPPPAGPSGSAAPFTGLPPRLAAAQLLVVSSAGPGVGDGLRRLILDGRVGAVLLLAENFDTAAELRRITDQLRELARQAQLPAPLLVMTDQEGGRVARVHDTVVQLPSELVLGQRGPAGVRTALADAGRGLRDLGVGCDLAPVADLRTNPADQVIGDRSFGGDPALAAPLVAAAVAGLHDGGEASTLKHFPGLGGQAGDPHAALPADPVTLARWRDTQARSFGAGIAAGADLVMTTAVSVPGLDPSGTPALLSPRVVTGLLRQELGFRGVIITDSLSLRGVSDSHPLPDATVGALAAGNDLALLGSGSGGDQQAALDAVAAAIEAGRLPPEAVRASLERILALRQRYGLR